MLNKRNIIFIYIEMLTSDSVAKREILQRIMTYNEDLIPLFQEFCIDFGFDIQDCLLLYLQTIIKTWDPKLNIRNYNGKKGKIIQKLISFHIFNIIIMFLELHINEDDVNQLSKKCNSITTYILDKVALKNWVTMIFSQV